MSDPDPGARARRCPICGRPAEARHRPFCSTRCALLDLGRWLEGDYRLPTDESVKDGPREDEEG